MGLFDSVYIACPSCGKTMELQSKSGPCEMARYSANSVPIAVASYAVGDAQCEHCGAEMRIDAVPDRVVLQAVLRKD